MLACKLKEKSNEFPSSKKNFFKTIRVPMRNSYKTMRSRVKQEAAKQRMVVVVAAAVAVVVINIHRTITRTKEEEAVVAEAIIPIEEILEGEYFCFIFI